MRMEQKRLYRKLFLGLTSVAIAFLAVLFIGLPLLAKIIVLVTPASKEAIIANQTADSYLFPPVLDPLVEATNSAKIVVSGTGEKDSKVKILVNNKAKITIPTDKDGKFKTANITLTEGDNTISAVTIKDNKDSSPSSVMTVVYNKEPPSLDISAPQDDEKFSGDQRDIVILGETAPENKVIVNDRSVIVGNNGKFNYRVTLSDGDNTFKITAIDPAGNKTEVEKKVKYIL